MEKPKQRSAVIREEIRNYGKQYGMLLLVSLAAAVLCYGFLVFSGTIRIDTEELMNHPGSKLGWLSIGRFGLAFLKDILGLQTHHMVWSGLLFFLFFWLGANLLTFGIYHFSGGKSYSYWIFLLLYSTSNIWSYQVYFSVQQAEVACAMLLLVSAAFLSVQAVFEKMGAACIWRLLVSFVLLVLGLGAYQALAVYYIAACLIFFLVGIGRETGIEQEQKDGRLLLRCLGLVLFFACAYAAYAAIADAWFMAGADYMNAQSGWSRYPVTDCIKNVLRTAKNLLFAIGPRNFSFYTAAALLTAVWLVRIFAGIYGRQGGRRFVLWLLALTALLASPLFMTIYMGEMLVTRAQFALPLAAAFLGMYAIDGLSERVKRETKAQEQKRTAGVCVWARRLGIVFVSVVLLGQCTYNLRLAYTDQVRFEDDAAKTEQLLTLLAKANGGTLPTQPIAFIGYQQAELPKWCRRTEMYGWSFYEWDYDSKRPAGATHRIVGLIQAYTGAVLEEAVTEEQLLAAAQMAQPLSDFPADGCIAVTDELVVVRLSAQEEPPATDWW